MRRSPIAISTYVLVAGALALPTEPAEACSPPLPGLERTLPAEGAQWPGNAAVVLYGYDVNFDALSVTIDDAPGAFVRADGRLGTAAFIEPAPAEGATVRVTGRPCMPWADEELCPPIDWSFIAAAPDGQPPTSPVALQIDLLDHEDVPSEPGLCEPGADYAYFVAIELGAGVATDRLVLEAEFEGEWRRVGGAGVRPGGEAVLRVAGTGPAPDAPPCMRARILDHAEQWSEPTATVCALCRARVDETPLDFSPPHDPPLWSADDRVEGGQCFDDEPTPEPEPDPEPEPEPGPDASIGFDAGPGGADAGELSVDDGGDCRAAPGRGGAPGGLWMLIGLAALLGRRVIAGGPSRR